MGDFFNVADSSKSLPTLKVAFNEQDSGLCPNGSPLSEILSYFPVSVFVLFTWTLESEV